MSGAYLVSPLLSALGALFEHHFKGDPEQHEAAGNAEAVELDMQRPEQSLAEKGEDQQDDRRNRHRTQSHGPRLCIARLLCQAGIDRRASRRINHDEKGDEGRNEELRQHWQRVFSNEAVSAPAPIILPQAMQGFPRSRFPNHPRTSTRP